MVDGLKHIGCGYVVDGDRAEEPMFLPLKNIQIYFMFLLLFSLKLKTIVQCLQVFFSLPSAPAKRT